LYNKNPTKNVSLVKREPRLHLISRISSTNKTDRHDITEILLKVALDFYCTKKMYLRDGPFNLLWFFLKKIYSDSQCWWQNILILVDEKKNLIQSLVFVIIFHRNMFSFTKIPDAKQWYTYNICLISTIDHISNNFFVNHVRKRVEK
jgi:hypothetical protein